MPLGIEIDVAIGVCDAVGAQNVNDELACRSFGYCANINYEDLRHCGAMQYWRSV